jgi:hypothetical protein
MDIGKPSRTYTVEPLEDPVPRELPGGAIRTTIAGLPGTRL